MRRLHERRLLERYLETLHALGAAAPSADAAWLLYRQHMIWAYMWVLCPVQLQAEAICTINATRAVAAIDELGTLEALGVRSEEHTSELQSLMRISYSVFCLQKKKISSSIR